MNCVERVKALCKERKVPISKLEKDLGFANGYIGQLRKGVLPADRLLQVAEYLGVSTEFLMTGNEKTPTVSGERNLEDFKAAFFEGYGEDLPDEEKEAIWEDAREYAKFKLMQKKQRKG